MADREPGLDEPRRAAGLLIQIGSDELLLDDAVRLAANAASGGVDL
jgi:hypothetical protein